ncbi:MAG: hypothetical protein WC107_07985 [Patescibacteria group bacterium]|jgi:hypothetical protein
MITLSDTRRNFPAYTKHKQIGGKQLFIGSQPTDTSKPQAILVSYYTIVGFQSPEGV